MEKKEAPPQKPSQKKYLPFVIVAVAVVSLVAIYFGYRWFTRTDCNNIFEQTSDKLRGSFTVIENKGEIALGREKVQELAEGSQKVALHLKTCCMTLQNNLINAQQFESCIAGAKEYENKIVHVASMIKEANKAQGQGNSQLAEQKVTQAKDAATAALGTEKNLGLLVSPFSQPMTPPAQAAALPATSRQTVNLLSPEYAELITAPRQEWEQIFQKTSDFYLNPLESDHTVFGFKNNKSATITAVRICIPKTSDQNIKTLELLVSTDSPTGQFVSAGKVETQNIRMVKTEGWQEFTLSPVTAKYFKCIIRPHDSIHLQLYSFREGEEKSLQLLGRINP